MVDKQVLEQILQERYKDARNQLMQAKDILPAEYKGFIDEHLKSVEAIRSQLQQDISFYSLETGNPDNVIKSFKIRCAERFLNALIVGRPEHIMDYGMTYAEYITPNKQH